MGLALLVVASGCSGIQTSHSVSPATFFLPGLMKADPPPSTADPMSAESELDLEVAGS